MTSPSPVLWTPSDPASSQTFQFRQHINSKYNLSLSSYEDLWRWSCDHRSDLWSEVWDWERIIGVKGGGPFVDESARPVDNPLWFQGAKLNWAENQLRHVASRPNDVAVYQTSEHCAGWTPAPKSVTYQSLYDLVTKCQAGMKRAGLVKGDRVAFWGGTCLEAVVVLLATSSIGAIFSSAAADFGVDGVIERLEQIKPKLLFVTNAVVYGGAARPLLPLLSKLLATLAEPPQASIIIDHLPNSICATPPELLETKGVGGWEAFVTSDEGRVDGIPAKIEFEQLGFNDPIWILFSSGTTGKPKAIVHRQGGMLLDSLREHHLMGGMENGDVYFYYTTPGWMMFQYLVSGLATGATIVLYEGSPLKRPELLWEMVDELGITILGTSAKWIEQISKHYPDVKDKHSLATLRQILSTGSPLAPSLFDFIYDRVKKDVLLGSITGGSDICSVFAGRCTELGVIRGEIQARMLGFALDVESDDISRSGELVCQQAFPIQPVGFWPLPGHGFDVATSDAASQRYRDSYFKGDNGTWYHGDHVRLTESRDGNGGGIVMLGRSDGVLNPGGIRFGPADIYSVLDTSAFHALGVEDTLVVGLMVEDGTDEQVVLFVKMFEGKELSDDLVKTIKTRIRSARSARHVPSSIFSVGGIPVTLTGKKVEVPIRKVINGAPVSSINPSTLRNPECLEEYARIGASLRGV